MKAPQERRFNLEQYIYRRVCLDISVTPIKAPAIIHNSAEKNPSRIGDNDNSSMTDDDDRLISLSAAIDNRTQEVSHKYPTIIAGISFFFYTSGDWLQQNPMQ